MKTDKRKNSGVGADGVAAPALTKALGRHIEAVRDVQNLERLSGGASQETWAFDAITDDGRLPLILRRGVGDTGDAPANPMHVPLETEAGLITLAATAGVPVARVRGVLDPDDGLGSGYFTDRVEGETIARKILRDDAFANIRPELARQCGEIAARIHSIPAEKLPKIGEMPAKPQLDYYRSVYDRYDYPHPVFELAFKWLEQYLPQDPPELRPVHGDFRNGNLIIDSTEGVRAVLDWELAHLGDPMEDLGWICVTSWRFGNLDQPAGGFGSREDLFTGYESAGGDSVDPRRVRFWEVFGSLKWGIMCMTMYDVFRTGADRSVERAAIGRRASETEIDLLRIITGDA